MSKNISKDFGSVDLLKGTRLIANSATAKGAFISGNGTNAIIENVGGGANSVRVRLVSRNGKSALGLVPVTVSVKSRAGTITSVTVASGVQYGIGALPAAGAITVLTGDGVTGVVDLTFAADAARTLDVMVQAGNEYAVGSVAVN